MTDPLIDWDVLFELIDGAVTKHIGRATTGPARDAADAVLDYLRSALTPEALNPAGGPHYRMLGTAAGLHRRIFGKDQA